MRAAVGVLLALAACGGRAPIKGAPDGAVDGLEAGADEAALRDAGSDTGALDVALDVGAEVDVGAPEHPMSVLTQIESDIDVPVDVSSDGKAFYFISQARDGSTVGPWSIFRLPLAGGKAEPLAIPGVSPQTMLGIARGLLIYSKGVDILSQDLTTGANGIVLHPTGEYAPAVKITADGVYWFTVVGDDRVLLQRRLAGATDIETLTDTLRERGVVAADGQQVFLAGQSRGISVWDVAAKTERLLYPIASAETPRTVLFDQDAIYLIENQSLYRASRAGSSVQRLATWQGRGLTSSEPLLIGSRIVWRIGSEDGWVAVSVRPGSAMVPLAGLRECDSLVTAAGRVFCVSIFHRRIYEVTLSSL